MSETPTHVIHQHWSGSTAGEYTMASTATARLDSKPPIPTSVPADMGGDDGRWNPEDLFGAALSTCFMYTFLAPAKKVRIDVRAYDDTLSLDLITEDRHTRITRAVVAPTITLAPGSSVSKATTMFEKSHKYCIIANSTSAEVVLQPQFVVAEA